LGDGFQEVGYDEVAAPYEYQIVLAGSLACTGKGFGYVGIRLALQMEWFGFLLQFPFAE
jgi:hypothetical protein